MQERTANMMAESSVSTIGLAADAPEARAAGGAGLLDRLVGFRLRQAQLTLSQALQDVTQDYGLTVTQFGVLALVGERPGINQTDLGVELGIDRSTMVAVIDRLQNRGLVQRHASPRDRRSYALALSQEGSALLDEIGPQIEERDRAVMAELDEEERRQLVSLLSRIVRSPD
jgi:DNA-binding MarR family transcriptional regulator